MSKIEEIYQGWKNLTFSSPEIEALARERASVCAPCPKNVANICTQCGCWLSAKVRSKESKCPLNKWKE